MKNEKTPQTIIRKRLRRVAGKLLEDSSLRSHLEDDKAQQLLDWGLAQVKAKVQATADLSDEEAEKTLEETVTAVRMVMHSINHLMGPAEKTAEDEPLTENHLLDDRMTRLFKNLSWLTGQPSGLNHLMAAQRFNQNRSDPPVAFQNLMSLLQPPAATQITGEEPQENES